MDIANNDPLQPVDIVFRTIANWRPSPSTRWRFIKRGLAGPNGERILLPVVYVGRKPHTTRTAVLQWLDKVTEARLAKIDRSQERSDDVSDDELRAAGLLGRNEGGAE